MGAKKDLEAECICVFVSVFLLPCTKCQSLVEYQLSNVARGKIKKSAKVYDLLQRKLEMWSSLMEKYDEKSKGKKIFFSRPACRKLHLIQLYGSNTRLEKLNVIFCRNV